jgi:3-deoxy-D-manno-octulosonic-acid transferase
MRHVLNALYVAALTLLSPYLLFKILTTGKYRRGLAAKLTGRADVPPTSRRRVWLHGVSVGEIFLLQKFVRAFRARHPDWDCVVSTTTDTGFDEARKRFADLRVFWWPFDFSWAVRRALRTVRPDLVVLAESEVWPNFLLSARAAGVPVAVVNARMSPRSHRRCLRLAPLVRPLFARLDLVVAQTPEYAECFRSLGAAHVEVAGNVKYHGLETDAGNPRTQSLCRRLGVRPGDLVFVAGSTQAPEEEIALRVFRAARTAHPNLRLILVPRQRDRFEEVARLLQRAGEPFLRRSTLGETAGVANAPPVVLLDTIGELEAVWGLADVAFVGGSLDGRRGGQNMIEPAAYGAAVVFGPHTWNFRDTVLRLTEAGGAVEVKDADELGDVVRRFLGDEAERRRLGQAARNLVLAQQGATDRTVDALDRLLSSRPTAPARRAG